MGTPPVDRQIDGRTDACQNITFPSYYVRRAVITFENTLSNRFHMPRVPLRELKPELFPDSEDEEDAFDSDDLDTDLDIPLLQN